MTQVDVPSFASFTVTNERIHTPYLCDNITVMWHSCASHQALRRDVSDRVYCHVRRRIPIQVQPVETLVLVIP